MSSILFGKKYLNLSIGNLSYSINAEDLTSYLTIPLPQTVGKKPFGLQLFYDLDGINKDNIINFGKGITFSSQLFFDNQVSEENTIYVTDLLGNKRKFIQDSSSSMLFTCDSTGEQLILTDSNYTIVETDGTKLTFGKNDKYLSKYESPDSTTFEYFMQSGAQFKYFSTECAVEFKTKALSTIINRIDILQHTSTSETINYQVFLTYDSNNYLSQIEYKEGSTTLEKYTFTRTTSTITIEDVLLHKKLVITTSGQTKTISSYIHNVLIGTQSITKGTLKSTLTNAEGKKTEYGYNIKNQLEYEINENGWAVRHYFDNWNRKIETSRTIQIFSHKTLSENLLENGNFSSGSLKYDLDGNARLLDTLTTSSILDGKFVGKWCSLTPLSGKSAASISQTITKSGHKGEPFTAVLLGYKNDTVGTAIDFWIYFYDANNKCIGEKYKTEQTILGKLVLSTLSVEAPGEYSKIKVEVGVYTNQGFYMKELGLYEIGVGKRITYGYHGAVRKVQTGNEEVRTTMDQNNRLLSLTSSSFSGDLVEEYNDKNQPTKSVDIFGNTTEMEYDEDGELISQRIQCVNVYSVSKRTISYNYGTITTKTTTEIDTRDQTSVEVVEVNSNSLKSYLDPLSKKEEYGYNAYHDLIKVKESKNGTTLGEQNITYNANRQIQKVVSGNGSQIEFEYNDYGLPEYVYLDVEKNTPVENYYYENDDAENQPKTGRIWQKIYGDSHYIEDYEYNENGQLSYIDYIGNNESSLPHEYSFTYDKKERLTHVYSKNNLLRRYSYTPEDDISKIQITQGETIDIIRKENKEGYVVSRMTPNGEHSFEYNSQYDEASKRSPGAIINGVFQEFYSCFFTEKDTTSEKYITQLRKEENSGRMLYLTEQNKRKVAIAKDGRIPYAIVDEKTKKFLCYDVEQSGKSIFVGCMFHKLPEFVQNENWSIFSIKLSDNCYVTLKCTGNTVFLERSAMGNEAKYATLPKYYLTKEWNYFGIKITIDQENHCTKYHFFVNQQRLSCTDSLELTMNNEVQVFFSPRSNEVSSLIRAYGWYTDLMIANTDLSLENICRYIDGLYHHLLEVEKEGSTWKQEAVQTKHTVLGVKENNGITDWDFIPLNGCLTSVKGNREVTLTEKDIYYHTSNSFYIYDEDLRQEVLDLSRWTLSKKLSYPSDKDINLCFDFKVTETTEIRPSNQFLLSIKDFHLTLDPNTSDANILTLYHKHGVVNKQATNIQVERGKWYQFHIAFVHENGFERMYLKVGEQMFTNVATTPLEEDLKVIISGGNQLRVANILYGYGTYASFNGVLNKVKINTETDRLGRTLITEIEDNGSVVLKKTYTYEDRTVTENGNTEKRTSGIVSKEVDTYGGKQTTTSYIFDELGRVTSKSLGASVTNHTFEYDARGFLSQERLPTSLQRYVYEYDNNGNIKTVKYYKNSSTVTPTITTFTYGIIYKDRLERVGTDVLEYEESNPLYVKRIYDSSTQVEKMNFTWRGSKLSKLIVNENTEIQYDYNEDGTRRKKTIKRIEDGTSTIVDRIIYSYVGGQLQSETHSKGYQLQYFYGLDGRLSFFIYRKDNVETRYYYRWDLLGITGIIDRDGNEVANYSYDAYGNMKIIHLDDTIGAINPMRYKGYYYDSETGFVIVKQRYYNPEIYRFIQSTDVSNLNQYSINGLNLYIYANNNPISIVYKAKDRTSNIITNNLKLDSTTSIINQLFVNNSLIYFKTLTFSVGLVTPKGPILPNGLDFSALYISGHLGAGGGYSVSSGEDGTFYISIASLEMGIVSMKCDVVRFDEASLYLGLGALNANASIGLGLSGNVEIISFYFGVKVNDYLSLDCKVYVGWGISVDFSDGIKFGIAAGIGFEISISF